MHTDFTDCQYRAQIPLHKSSKLGLWIRVLVWFLGLICFLICKMSMAILPSSWIWIFKKLMCAYCTFHFLVHSGLSTHNNYYESHFSVIIIVNVSLVISEKYVKYFILVIGRYVSAPSKYIFWISRTKLELIFLLGYFRFPIYIK